ncbi:MAG: BrnT family toxin [Clostridiales bacterium]|jgi:uncharacterized DUF497 family protein|nr:BrnT family toxin [Clostridiales bacterium]
MPLVKIRGRFFSWDEDKYESNIKKHGVNFHEAASVFDDLNAFMFYDSDHSEDEDRFIVIGISEDARLLMVCHCYWEKVEVARIISARKATKNEEKMYTRRKLL